MIVRILLLKKTIYSPLVSDYDDFVWIFQNKILVGVLSCYGQTQVKYLVSFSHMSNTNTPDL